MQWLLCSARSRYTGATGCALLCHASQCSNELRFHTYLPSLQHTTHRRLHCTPILASPLHPVFTPRISSCRQQLTYQMSAIAATTGVSALAVLATYYKFSHHMTGPDAAFPWADMAGTLALVFGGVVGMEMWARWAHRALWHDFAPGWALHKSHHEPRIGPFEVSLGQLLRACMCACVLGWEGEGKQPGALGGLVCACASVYVHVCILGWEGEVRQHA